MRVPNPLVGCTHGSLPPTARTVCARAFLTPTRRTSSIDPVPIPVEPARQARLTVLDFVARARLYLETDDVSSTAGSAGPTPD